MSKRDVLWHTPCLFEQLGVLYEVFHRIESRQEEEIKFILDNLSAHYA